MSYKLLEFRCGTSRPQGYVLQGTDEHQGTNESVSVEDVQHFGADAGALAAYLDYRFLRAHKERVDAALQEG